MLMVRANGIPSKNTGPEGYIENKGQITDQNLQPNPSVKYLLLADGLNIQLRQGGFSYDSYTMEADEPVQAKPMPRNDLKHPKPYRMLFNRVDIEFVGANPEPMMEALVPSDDYTNYYNGEEEGILFVHSYQKIVYHDLYPGIDLEFGIENHQPKYNFIVHPGANPSLIRWKYIGASDVRFAESKIMLKVIAGFIEETIPETFVKETGNRVALKYQHTGSGEFSFSAATYPGNQTLVIDPAPWATYYGASGEDDGMSIAVDRWGNVLMGGFTSSTTNIASSGAHQSTFGGGQSDGLIVKFSSTGARRWATYYGGAVQGDWIYGIACGQTGNVYIGGTTGSTAGIASTGAFQTVMGGDYDGFIARFDSTGVRRWGTYIGGNTYDYAYTMTIDKNENVIITGETFSTNGIATAGAIQTNKNSFSSSDSWIEKFDSSGARTWGTYYGGDGIDIGYGITTDTSNNIIIAGYTWTGIGFSTPGVFQPTGGGGMNDGYVLKLGPGGNRIWCTYFGNGNDEHFRAVVTDKAGNIYAAGFGGTNITTTGMASPGAYQTSTNGGSESMIVKFTPNGARVWSTYYGGNGDDAIRCITIDKNAFVYVAGETSSTSAIASAGCWQSVNGGGALDGFVARFDSSGTRLWSTYYGGNGNDAVYGVGTDTLGTLFLTGGTVSASGIVRPGSYQTVFVGSIGSADAFISAFTNTGFLPVQLLSFNVNRIEEGVQVNWITASETNSDRFEIERSTDAQNWSLAGTIAASGNSADQKRYRYDDHDAFIIQSSTLFYRLKQVDRDGSFTYSEIATLGSLLENEAVFVYPNPFSEQLFVKNVKTLYTVTVIDYMGKIQLLSEVSKEGSIDGLDQLIQGLYTIELRSDQEVQRFVVLKK
jgi:hypothetical protein